MPINDDAQDSSLDSALVQILLKQSYITPEEASLAEEYVKQNNSSVVEYLLSQGLITNVLLGQAVAEAYNVSYADLETNTPTRTQVQAIPEEIARRLRIVLF